MTGQPEGLLYIPDFLSDTEQIASLDELQLLPYTHDVFHGRKMRRGYAQFGYAYVTTSRKLKPALALPAFLQAVISQASPYYPASVTFTQLIVTHYPSGAGIGWHTDAPVFSEYILGISLASEARLQFRPKKSQKASFEVKVAPGSLYVMHGSARYDYEHRIMPVKTERYSLTFRCLAQA